MGTDDGQEDKRARRGARHERRAGAANGGRRGDRPAGAVPLCRYHHWLDRAADRVCVECGLVTRRELGEGWADR